MMLISILLFFSIFLAFVQSYPYYLSCSTPLTAGSVIMGSTAVSSSSRSVVVKRGVTTLSSGATFIPGETLQVSISSTSGEWIFEATNAPFSGGSCTNNIRSPTTVSPTSLVMPSNGTVTIKVAWATAFGTVSISNIFSLVPETSSPSAEPTQMPSEAPTATPTSLPSVMPSAISTFSPNTPTAVPSLPVPTTTQPTSSLPIASPSTTPTPIPTRKPTTIPTLHPSATPPTYKYLNVQFYSDDACTHRTWSMHEPLERCLFDNQFFRYGGMKVKCSTTKSYLTCIYTFYKDNRCHLPVKGKHAKQTLKLNRGHCYPDPGDNSYTKAGSISQGLPPFGAGKIEMAYATPDCTGAYTSYFTPDGMCESWSTDSGAVSCAAGASYYYPATTNCTGTVDIGDLSDYGTCHSDSEGTSSIDACSYSH